MKKSNTLLLIVILVIICLVALNMMWLSELKDINSNKMQDSVNRPTNNKANQNIKFIDMTIHKNRMDPLYIAVNKGDKVIISFADANASELEFVGYPELSQKVKLYNIEFTANRQGIYEYYCLNCVDKMPGLLIVN